MYCSACLYKSYGQIQGFCKWCIYCNYSCLLNVKPWEKGFSCNCKIIMTRCALSFQNVTNLFNNHSEISKLISTSCCWILTTGLNCTFSSRKCFLSAVWSDLKVLGVKCELLLKFGLKGWLEEDYENLSHNLVSVDPDPSSLVRLFGDQLRCPAPAVAPVRWMVKVPRPLQTDSIVQSWQRPYFYVNHLFTSVCKHVERMDLGVHF